MPSQSPAIQVSLLEPIVVLRSSKDTLEDHYDRPITQDESGFYVHLDENLNQLRGLVTLNYDRLPVGATEVQVKFCGASIWVEWKDSVPRTCFRDIASLEVIIPLPAAKNSKIPFSIPIPSNLPPSVDADSGSNRYAVTAIIQGSSPSKLVSAEVSVRLDTAKTESRSSGSERVEGLCFDNKVQYVWTADEQVCVGANFSMSLSIRPLVEYNLSVGLLHILLEELTSSSLSSPGKPPVVKRWSLAKLQPSCPHSLLPWNGQTGCSQADAALLSAGLVFHEMERNSSKLKSTNTTEAEIKVREQLASKSGPWNLSWKVATPSCSQTAINNTIKHPKSVVSVSHRLVLQMLFKGPNEAGSGLEMTRPITILSSFLAEPGSALPCYYCDCLQDHPYNHLEHWRQVAAEECAASSSNSNVMPAWLIRLIASSRRDSSAKNGAHIINNRTNNSSQMWLDLSSQTNSIPT